MIAHIDGIELAYEDAGQGLPLVMIHAFPLDRRMWKPQIGGLVPQCRCISPDLRGFGESSVVPPFTMDRHAEDVIRLLDHLQVERAVFAGLSMGGYVSFAIWRRHRDRVRALVLADTRAGADDEAGRERRKEMIELAREQGAGAVAGKQIGSMVGKSSREKLPDVYDSIYSMMCEAPVAGIMGALEGMMQRPDSTSLLRTIDVPTLVIVGDEDAITPPREARAMHEQIPGSRLEVLAGAGHMSNMERPAAFTHVVSEFVASLVYS
jgi:3-oxoadipate enol-lactonase